MDQEIGKTKGSSGQIILIIIIILLIITGGFLGYLFYQKNQTYNLLKTENENLKQLTTTENTTNKDEEPNDLAKENTALQEANFTLNKLNGELKAKILKAGAYNSFLEHMNQVIETHKGFTGWTDAEFKKGKEIAEATGDTAFVSTVNWAWYEKTVDPTTRVITTWKAIEDGIENSLK